MESDKQNAMKILEETDALLHETRSVLEILSRTRALSVYDAHRSGWSYSQIALKLSVSKSVVVRLAQQGERLARKEADGPG